MITAERTVSVTNSALLASSLALAVVPPLLCLALAGHLLDWGVWFNPLDLVGYLWVAITLVYWHRVRTRKALLLFLMFPLAFFRFVSMLLLVIAVRTGNFGR